VLGEAEGVQELSSQDWRHYWATVAMQSGTAIRAVQEADGWNLPVMPLRCAAARINVYGVKLA
jgi:integrase